MKLESWCMFKGQIAGKSLLIVLLFLPVTVLGAQEESKNRCTLDAMVKARHNYDDKKEKAVYIDLEDKPGMGPGVGANAYVVDGKVSRMVVELVGESGYLLYEYYFQSTSDYYVSVRETMYGLTEDGEPFGDVATLKLEYVVCDGGTGSSPRLYFVESYVDRGEKLLRLIKETGLFGRESKLP